jgi:hypothetical protein
MAATIDDLTANTIRQALAAAAAGRLPDAIATGEKGLSSGGDAAALVPLECFAPARVTTLAHSIIFGRRTGQDSRIL